MPSFKFPKNRRLCNTTLIKHLLNKGNVINSYPIKAVWRIDTRIDSASPVQLLVVVSKKRFKSAVQRNYLKRLLRECFRKVYPESICLPLTLQQQLSIALIYTGSEKVEYFFLHKKIKDALWRLNKDAAFILE